MTFFAGFRLTHKPGVVNTHVRETRHESARAGRNGLGYRSGPWRTVFEYAVLGESAGSLEESATGSALVAKVRRANGGNYE